jgi:hypothetical protein
MKISDKVYRILHTHSINEIPTVLHNSLYPRPELLTGADDDLPVHASHYSEILDLRESRVL